MIAITGDTHIPHDIHKLRNDSIKGNFETPPNYVIVTGDFGLLWSNEENNPTEIHWKKWLEEKPFITLFCGGNHENWNRLNALPTVNVFGAEVGQISDKIFHLRHSNIYTIENKTFFVLGGAESTDKDSRILNISWWPEEVPSYKDFYTSLENLEKVNYTVDYVLTHTAPKSVVQKYFDDSGRYNDPTCAMLESIYERLTFKKWFFGHFHEDQKLNDKFSVCYNKFHTLY